MAQVLSFAQQMQQAQAPTGLPPAPSSAPVSPVSASLAPIPPPPVDLPVQGPLPGVPVGPGLPAFSLANGGPGVNATDPTRSGLANLIGLGAPATTQEHAANLDKLAAAPDALSYLSNFVAGNAAGKAKLDEQANNAAVFNHPDIKSYLTANPAAAAAAVKDPTGTASALHGALTAAMQAQAGMHTYATPTGNFSKTPQDAAALAAQSHILGEDAKHVLPFAEHHQFTDDEFINATQGLNWKQASRIFGMQHYQTPQQQLLPNYLAGLDASEAAAKKAVDDAVANKLPGDKLKTAQDNYAKIATENAATRKVLVEGAQSIYPSSAIGGNVQ